MAVSRLSVYYAAILLAIAIRDKEGAQKDYGEASGLWPCYSGCCGGSELQGNPNTYYERGRALARRGDKRGAIENLQQAANLFRVQGKTNRYKETLDLIMQLQR